MVQIALENHKALKQIPPFLFKEKQDSKQKAENKF